MTEAINAELLEAGWSIMDDDGFIHLVGPVRLRSSGRTSTAIAGVWFRAAC
jgi:hypothetical protein